GCKVTLIDRQDGPGRETSFANGGLLTPSMTEPWNAPGSWRVLLASLGQSNAALQLRARALPGLVRWGASFLRNSSAKVFDRNSLANFRLAEYSLEVMRALRHETRIEFGHSARGSLRLFRDGASLERALRMAATRIGAGLSCRRLSTTEAVKLEPA